MVDTTAEPDLLHPPLKVRGVTFRILKHALEIIPKKSLFGREPVVPQLVSWDSLAKCDLQFGCFSGTIILKQDNAEVISISGGTSKLREVARVIYPLMNSGVTKTVDTAVQESLGKRSKTTLLGNGLIVTKKTGCCSGIATFIPWDSVVLAELATGCWSSSIKLKTMIHQEDLGETRRRYKERVASKEAVFPMPDPKSTEQHSGPIFLVVLIPGRSSALKVVYQEVLKLMAVGQEMVEIPDAPKIKNSSISSTGIALSSRRKQTFVPWNSVSSLEWSKTFFSKGTVIMTDRTGLRIDLNGVDSDDYDALRGIYIERGASDLSRGRPQAIVRKHMRIAWDGISIPVRKRCSKVYEFYPWTSLDAAELEVNCCGGSLVLIAESGRRIKIWSASRWSLGKLTETLQRINELKYRCAITPKESGILTFAGKPGDRRAAVLTNTSLRLVASTGLCSSIACVLDLDSVDSCEITTTNGCFSKTFLTVYVEKKIGSGMGIGNALSTNSGRTDGAGESKIAGITVRLSKTDDAVAIRDDIMRRANQRKRDESRSTDAR